MTIRAQPDFDGNCCCCDNLSTASAPYIFEWQPAASRSKNEDRSFVIHSTTLHELKPTVSFFSINSLMHVLPSDGVFAPHSAQLVLELSERIRVRSPSLCSTIAEATSDLLSYVCDLAGGTSWDPAGCQNKLSLFAKRDDGRHIGRARAVVRPLEWVYRSFQRTVCFLLPAQNSLTRPPFHHYGFLHARLLSLSPTSGQHHVHESCIDDNTAVSSLHRSRSMCPTIRLEVLRSMFDLYELGANLSSTVQ
ncbi:hypothetical protein BJ546DRAFT_961718 [Cryomyces antarcticus]